MRSRSAFTIGLLVCLIALTAFLPGRESRSSLTGWAAYAQEAGGEPEQGVVSVEAQSESAPSEDQAAEEEELQRFRIPITEEPRYVSGQPRFLRIAFAEDGSKVLSVAFDESKGTGQGCDVLYADWDFDGRIGEADKRTAEIQTYESFWSFSLASFPPTIVPVVFNEEAGAEPTPCQVTFHCFKHSEGEEFGAFVIAQLVEDPLMWHYIFQTSETKPSETWETGRYAGRSGSRDICPSPPAGMI